MSCFNPGTGDKGSSHYLGPHLLTLTGEGDPGGLKIILFLTHLPGMAKGFMHNSITFLLKVSYFRITTTCIIKVGCSRISQPAS